MLQTRLGKVSIQDLAFCNLICKVEVKTIIRLINKNHSKVVLVPVDTSDGVEEDKFKLHRA